MDEKLLEKLQDAAALFYEEWVTRLLKRDAQYRRLSGRENEYEKKCKQLKETLPEDAVETIEAISTLRDREAMLREFWVFIIGLQAGIYFRDILYRSGNE